MRYLARHGFALLEMVIVILVLGIIAAVAAPRMFDPAIAIDERNTRHHLSVLRDAIELYHARSGQYPAINRLPAAMETMLNGPFPAPRIGTVRGDLGVYYDTDTDAKVTVKADPSQPGGWAYKPANGSLMLNVGSGEPGADW